jgi:phage shock protein C
MTTQTSPSVHPRRLTRSGSDRKLAGVAGGLGAYFSVDPMLFRIGFAVATLISGAGALAYLMVLVFVPVDADEAPASPVAPPVAVWRLGEDAQPVGAGRADAHG